MYILIADSGSTKCEWCLLQGGKKKKFETQGISPYFLNSTQIQHILKSELSPAIENHKIDRVFFYGTGCAGPKNKSIARVALKRVFLKADILVDHDLMGAARALCGEKKGIAAILGTGSNSCYFDGRKIVKNSPGLGYVLGDEGSGAYLGKKILQYYLYGIFDKGLKEKFEAEYDSSSLKILEHVYKMPYPNRYLASFTVFLAENRGHYMIENIVEEGINDFFFIHLARYKQSRNCLVHFVGGVAFAFRDVLKELCHEYKLEIGQIMRKPMDGLILYHNK